MGLFSRPRRRRAPAAAACDAASALAQHAVGLAAALARVEAREAGVAEREQFVHRLLARGAAELDERERALRAVAAELEERERRVADLDRREAELARREARLAVEGLELRRREQELEERAAPPPPAHDTRSHLVFARSAGGYRLVEGDGPPPEPGGRVLRVGPSPLPGDRRRCAYEE